MQNETNMTYQNQSSSLHEWIWRYPVAHFEVKKDQIFVLLKKTTVNCASHFEKKLQIFGFFPEIAISQKSDKYSWRKIFLKTTNLTYFWARNTILALFLTSKKVKTVKIRNYRFISVNFSVIWLRPFLWFEFFSKFRRFGNAIRKYI